MADIDLQNEINTLLDPVGVGVQPIAQAQPVTNVAPVTAAPTSPQAQAQVMPTTQNLNQQQFAQASTNTPQTSSLVPPIQNTRSYASSRASDDQKEKPQSSFLLPATIILVACALVGFFIFRKSLLGPLTYSDCTEIPGSTKVDLEPKYCVTPEGKMFFENKRSDSANSPVQTFDPALIPTSDSPS